MDKDEITLEQADKVLGGTTYENGKESFEKMDKESTDKVEDLLNRVGDLYKFENTNPNDELSTMLKEENIDTQEIEKHM